MFSTCKIFLNPLISIPGPWESLLTTQKLQSVWLLFTITRSRRSEFPVKLFLPHLFVCCQRLYTALSSLPRPLIELICSKVFFSGRRASILTSRKWRKIKKVFWLFTFWFLLVLWVSKASEGKAILISESLIINNIDEKLLMTSASSL